MFNPVLAEARLKKAKADAPDTNNTEGSENFNRSRNSDKSSSGSSGSSTLSLGTLQSMREQYEQHYKSFSGEPWTLASGTIVDEAIRSMVLTLTKESTLHSFVIDAPKKVLDLFEGEDRKAVEQGLLTKRDTNSADDAALKSAMAFLEKYISTPSATQTALSRGWRVDRNTEPQQLQDPVLFSDYIGDDDTQYWLYTIVLQLHRAYKQERFRLPMTNSESWYINKLWAFLPTLLCGPGGPGNALIHQPGEVQSKASVQRKNADRTLASKWIPGRKIDGLFICAKTGFELGAIEAARTDAGIQTTTKALSDSRKLGKLLKDMHDAVRNKACKEVQDELVTFGMQISRTTICLYTLHKVAGRHYCMQNDGAFTLPLEWDNEPESAAAILHLLDRLLQWRKQMEDMAKNVARWTRTGPPDGHYRDVIVPTLPSPSSSPKSERLSYF
ncbi:hypothetical protein BGW41_004277 [Actinomortierella wolfii]|nr:hypothetical protein BGW41_004277 [Actinomortierella wolfii]